MGSHSHPKVHTIVSHSDTTGTGAELEELTDGSETELHSHAADGGASASGTYTGNDTTNRAIPHGLGVTPKLVVIIYRSSDTAGAFFNIIEGLAYVVMPVVGRYYAVTAMNATNFYVGSGTWYPHEANGNGLAYYWMALG